MSCALIIFTEKFWTAVSRVNANAGNFSSIMKEKLAYDDQVKLNYGFQAMNPVWKDTKNMSSHNGLKTATTASGFTVTLFSEDVVCRRNCTEQLQSQYYVWHKLVNKRIQSKTNNSEKANLWLLRKDWATITTNTTGVQWLQEISH